MISLDDQILDNAPSQPSVGRKPRWLRSRLPGGDGYMRLRGIMDEHGLHTVCESAKCPNLGECWSRGTATLMILGDTCTRSCGFCHIKTGRPPTLDLDEPRRVGEAAALLRLKHIVITSVNRDELPDGGASIWVETIRQVRRQSPGTSVEVLIPDLCGDWDAADIIFNERPEILNHNLETVPRLYSLVRPQAKYDRSIELLRRSKAAGLTTKTGIMVGIGETDDEVVELMRDVVERTGARRFGDPGEGEQRHEGTEARRHEGAGGPCDILTIGQYLQPTRDHLPIDRWVTPEQFESFKTTGESLGFRHVESGPLVRSSYHAEEQVLTLEGQ